MASHLYSQRLKITSTSIFNDLIKDYFSKKSGCDAHAEEHGISRNATTPTVGCVLHLGKAFRPSLQKVFYSTFTTPCTRKRDFVAYAVSTCELFLRDGFPYLNRKMGVVNVPFFSLLMTFAIIAELLYFCMDYKCYAYISSTSGCLMVVYERFLSRSFEDAGGWEGLSEFCDDALTVYDCLPNETAGRVMGEARQSMLVTDIRKRIEDCAVRSGRLTVLSDLELELIGKFKEIDASGSCSLCGLCCKWYMARFLTEHSADYSHETSLNDGDVW